MRIGIIGAGQMGGALAQGLLEKRVVTSDDLFLSDLKPERLDELKQQLNVNTTTQNGQLVENSEVIIVAIKPQHLKGLLGELKNLTISGKVFVSIVAGAKISLYEDFLGENIKIVRVMPNSPCQVGFGVSVMSAGRNVNPDDLTKVKSIFAAVGEVLELPEDYLDIVTAISGSGPAFFYYFAEALIEAGVKAGLSREVATELVQGTMIGSGMMMKKTGKHPALLIDMVTSPGGTTIAGLAALDKKGFKAAVFKAVEAAFKRAKELS